MTQPTGTKVVNGSIRFVTVTSHTMTHMLVFVPRAGEYCDACYLISTWRFDCRVLHLVQ